MHAEGGTGYEHGAAVARSRDLFGPYDPDPAGPLLTSRYDPKPALQKAGHCSFVETPAGEWYAAHIVARPHGERGRCVLGRETALQPVTWTEGGWPRIAGAVPAVTVPAPALPPAPAPAPPPATDLFDTRALGPDWSTLRRPATPDWIKPAPGTLPVLRFSCDTGQGMSVLPLELDATVLSDEHADELHDGQLRVLGFTGAMLGLWAQDLDGAGVYADFAYVTYLTTTPDRDA